MKTGVIILCRYDSSRLPGKILKPLLGKPILQYIYERVKQAGSADAVIVATSSESSDDPIASYCMENQIDLFRGSKENVAGRFLACARTNHLDHAVRINGDNLFVDPALLERMLMIARRDEYDLISNVKGRTFPRGMSIEILRTSFYADVITHFTRPDHAEHVTLFLYENEGFGRQLHVKNETVPEAAGMNLSIDTPEDFIKAEGMFSRMKPPHTDYHLEQIVALYKGGEG